MMSTFLYVPFGIDPGFMRACDQTLEIVLSACRFITPTFMSIALLYTIFSGLFTGNVRMNWGPIVKATWVFFLLYFYQSLMETLGTGIGAFTALFAVDQSAAEALSALTTPRPVAAAAQNDSVSVGDIVAGASAMMSSIADTVSNFTFSGIMTKLFTATTVLIIREIMTFLQQFILGFLYVCGPIAMTLSVIPAFSQLAIKWFQNFLAVMFWGLTFVLLDTMYGFYAETQRLDGGILASGPLTAVDDTKFMLMSVSFVLLYCMVPWLTSLFIGSSAVQSFAGSMMGMAMGAASFAAGVAAPGGGGISSAIGRAIGNAGSSGGGGGGGGGGGESGGSSGGGGSSESSSASAGLATVTMGEALNPTYKQRPSGLWTT
jgi:hypothetical protein